MQNAIAMFYKHSRDSHTLWRTFRDKIKELDEWHDDFTKDTQTRYDNFIDGLRNKLDEKIEYVVNNYYDSSYAGDKWKDCIDSLDIRQMSQRFIKKIGDSAVRKMRQLLDTGNQELSYFNVDFQIGHMYGGDTDDTQGALMLAVPLLAFTPIGWGGALIVGLGNLLFGESKSKKIERAKCELRGQLQTSRNEILSNIGDNIIKIINEDIHQKTIYGFRDTLLNMYGISSRLAFEQNVVADKINEQYRDLNYDLFWEATNYSGEKQPKKVITARIVGKTLLLFTTSRKPDLEKTKKLLDENVVVCTVGEDDKFTEDVFNILEKIVLKHDFAFYDFIDEDWGKMKVIELPATVNFSAEQIQIAEQLLYSPVVYEEGR